EERKVIDLINNPELKLGLKHNESGLIDVKQTRRLGCVEMSEILTSQVGVSLKRLLLLRTREAERCQIDKTVSLTELPTFILHRERVIKGG
ncbi:hypothetical protein L9F63_000422, partial [Diploptera punctata]